MVFEVDVFEVFVVFFVFSIFERPEMQKSEPRAQGLGNRGGDHRPATARSQSAPRFTLGNTPLGYERNAHFCDSLAPVHVFCDVRETGPAGRGVGGKVNLPPPQTGSKHYDQGSTDFEVILGSFWGHFGIMLG